MVCAGFHEGNVEGKKMSLYSKRFAFHCLISDKKRDKGLKTPEDIERFDDIRYGDNKKWQVLDVYRPKNTDNKLPVIVSVHGGGWVYGSKEIYQYYCMNLAQRGFVVVNFSYRLAPKYKFPAGLEDTNTVFKWVLEHSDEYGMDIEHIFAVGDSAGATNVGIYAAMLSDNNLAEELNIQMPTNLKIRALGLNCGVYNMVKGAEVSLVKDIFEHGGNIPELNQLSLIYHLDEKFPPCFVMTSNGDFLKNQVPQMIKTLEENCIEFESKEYGTEEAPLYHVFHCNIKTEEAKKANDDEIAFFKKIINNACI